jgi:5-methylcytosine-specific restriction endonuclease McrA
MHQDDRIFLKRTLRLRDGNRCFFCRRPFTRARPATLEHLEPLSRGGVNDLANCRLACGPCNQAVADRCKEDKLGALVEARRLLRGNQLA